MRIGNLRRLYNLFHCRILHTKSNVIEECIIEQNSFLVYITNQTTQISNTHVADARSVNGNITFLYIVITRQQID